MVSTILAGFCGLSPAPASATEAQAGIVGPSGLPLPRFVYLKSGLPVEIVQEYDNWRRIRDSEGTEGWVLQTLLAGKRTALTAPWASKEGGRIGLFGQKDEAAARIADMEPGVMGKVAECDGIWCTFEAAGYEGYVKQTEIWGAYPGETFEN